MKRHSVVVLVLCIGFVLSLVGFAVSRGWEQNRIQDSFERNAESAIGQVERNIQSNLSTLTDLARYFSENPNIGREEFSEFVAPYLEEHSGLYALQWVPRVRQSQRTAYEEQAELDGHTGFEFTERKGGGQVVSAKDRDEYFPVYFVEPFEENNEVFGYDVASNPLQRKLLDAARDSGSQIATGTEPLVPQRRDLLGVFVISPVYLKGAPTESEEERRDNLRGFTIAALRVSDIVGSALQEVDNAWMDIYLYDDSDPTGSNFLHAHAASSRNRRTGSFERRKWELVRGPHIAETINVAGRTWSVLAVPIPGYVQQARTWMPWGILLCGLIFTGVAALVVLIVPQPFALFRRKKSKESPQQKIAEPAKEPEETQPAEYEKRVEQLRTNLERQQAETERKHLQERLTQTQSELQELTDIVAQSVSLPLRSIHASLNQLDIQEDHVKTLQARLSRVNGALDRVIEFSGVGQRDLSPLEDIDLQELIDSIAHALDPQAKTIIETDSDLPRVHARRIHLQQIFEYLLGRAIAAVGPKEASVQVESDVRSGRWKCWVKDNGNPIPPQYVDGIFDIGSLGGADWAKDSYTAGLPVVKKVVEFYSGSIKVESSDSEGTVFVMSFPESFLSNGARQRNGVPLQPTAA